MFLSKHFIFANDHVYFFYNLAMKAYEDHCRRTGEQVSHPLMKEMLAAFAAAEVDKLFETHGLDFLDRERAKRQAIQQAHQLAEQQYGAGGVFNANQYGQGGGFNSNQYGQGGGFNPNQYGQGGGFNGPPDSYGNYPQQGGYGMNQFNDPNYQQQGGFGMNQFNDPNYQQQGGEHHRHHHHNY
jgi:hypothetical protein